MKRISLLVVIALSTALPSVAQAGKKVEVYGGMASPARRTKKQKTIDRLLYTAQYFLLREGDLAAAAAEYRKVLALDRANQAASIALAELEIQRRKPKAAVKVLAALARKTPKDGGVWRALAGAQRAAGDRKGMVASCRAAIKLDPRDGDAHWLLFDSAHERWKAGDRAARAELEAAATGYVASGHLPMGHQRRLVDRTLIELRDDTVSLAVFDARAAYDEAFAQASYGAINGKMAEARRGFEQCIAAQPDRQECHYRLGLVYASVKASEQYDPAKAKAAFRRAKDMPEAHLELARLLRVEDDLDGAARELAQALKIAPQLALAHLELGIVRKLDGNDDAAVGSFVAAIEADRYSATADRALAELAKIRPKHELVTGAMMFGDIKGDVFSTDRFKAAVKMVEDQLGGVEEGAPETAALEAILARLRAASDLGSRFSFRVAILKSEMVNAFALPDGSIYFTRGLFDFLRSKWPKRAIDGKNDVIGHIMGHEMAHVLRRHTLQTLIYQEAVNDSSRWLDPTVLTHVTRLHEIEADREGIVLAFLAGFHPRGGVEFMEVSGQEMEIPSHLDHPTYEERVHYLEEYWSNDVRYAFLSFQLGLDSLRRAATLEAASKVDAAAAYEQAIDHFKRYRTTLKATREVLNNLGIAYAKIGLMAMGKRRSPLTRWQTRFSIEEQAALKYVGIVREEGQTRGGKNDAAPKVPWQMREAVSMFEEALKIDRSYLKATVNLALCELALGKADAASRRLAPVKASGEIDLVRGIVLAESGKWDAAATAFGRALKIKSTARAARYNLARTYQMTGKKEQARASYQAYLKLDRDGAWGKAAQRSLKQL
jgi:predicted Zn-dependent protease